VSRPLRIVLAIALPGALLVFTLCKPQLVLQGLVLPAATALWLILRTFVVSIDQGVYWWGLIVLVLFGSFMLLLRGADSRAGAHFSVARPAWDPSRRWQDSIVLGRTTTPSRDTFRQNLTWLLSSLYASPRSGEEKYQVRGALQEGRISIPRGVHDFLFASTRPPDPPPSFFANPRACLGAVLESFLDTLLSRPRGRRRAAEYDRSTAEVLSFMETQLEMTHELDSDV
jgi:hypothetical protein